MADKDQDSPGIDPRRHSRVVVDGLTQAPSRAMLRAVGFARSRSVTPQPSAIYRGLRAAAHQLKGKNRFNLAFRQDRMVFHAEK